MARPLRILHWTNERLPVRETLKFVFDEEIPGGSNYFYALGSATLFVFFLQILSGIWQLFFYVPTIDHAYASVSYMRISVPFGWLIHGIHYWGSQAMIVIVGLHLIRVFIWGAYKSPRELIWLAGVILLILTAAMSFTGVLLPWDEVGYFAARVGLNIAGTFPLVGKAIKNFTMGGTEIGQLTLSRFFIMHVAILPAVLLGFITIHLVAFRQFGSVGPWKKKKNIGSGPFWPDQVFKDVLVSILILMVLVFFSAYIRAPFSGPADPLDISYHPKPEWNFLFLYQALKGFKGAWEPVGTVILPVVLVLFLLLVPFMDFYKERDPIKRPAIVISVLAVCAGIIVLTIAGSGSVPDIGKVSPSQTKIEPAVNAPEDIKEGRGLFVSNNCAICHSINGAGGKIGPDLSHETAKGLTAVWIANQIRNPKINDPKSIMPPFPNLSQEQLKSIADYLLNVDKGSSLVVTEKKEAPSGEMNQPNTTPTENSQNKAVNDLNRRSLNGLAASLIGNPEHGEVLFRQQCEGCHGVDGKGTIANPGSTAGIIPVLNPVSKKYFNPSPGSFVADIDTIIQHGSIPAGPGPAFRMPAFGESNTLSQQQIAQIEAYILSINGVDRAEILTPGIKPRYFVWLSTGIFLILILYLITDWVILNKKVRSGQ